MSDSATIAAADLIGFRLCTGQCLLGLEEKCHCRCGGRWHAVLAEAEIRLPAHLTLADAVSSGSPAGLPPHRIRRPASGQHNGTVTAEAVELAYAADLADAEIPSIRRIKRDMRVGQGRARSLQQHLERVLSRRLAELPRT